jgi:hypothetical protein
MMETEILNTAFFIVALANIIFLAIAIITKNAEGQLYSVFMSFVLIMLSVMYDRPVFALVGGGSHDRTHTWLPRLQMSSSE